MTLAALIAAYHEADEPGGGLRATLPLAGRTVLERQARLAVAVGADLIVVAVERVPSDLLAALDRLRGQGLRVAVARSAEEAAEAVHPSDRLLIMADGLIATETHLERLIAAGGPAILTVPDVRVDDRYERIDAHSRWAGLALLDGETLKRTAAMLGEWDLQSTLLRRAIQNGVRQFSVRGEPADDLLTVAERGEDLAELQQRLFEGAGAQRGDWISRYLLGPVEQEATRRLMPTATTPAMLGLGAALLTALGALSFASGWLVLGMALILLATPLDGIGERLAMLRMQDAVTDSWWSHLLPTLAAAGLVALAVSLSGTLGWGCIVLAATTIAFVLALRTETRGRSVPGRLWLAERKGMSWLLLPFAATGLWGSGLTILLLYAAGSFFWAQRHVHRPDSAPRAD
ncbi:hypothetical protein E2493_18510 [Sphingomonas parva]|uniref:Uncharacterized protein n=1 Tax=Sphingomonas parva TaxID=2555898 RepID=A0A4Y8ZL65_9SPHN|nr:hypothetical protein [Sphingomonas parva]TFI56753.1 hypothetical protein E2493_18510 [Sphingomonas parva]